MDRGLVRSGLLGLAALALLLVASAAHAQPPDTLSGMPGRGPSGVRGRFQDSSTRTPVPGVQVRLTAIGDTSVVHRATARDDGGFFIRGVAPRRYRLVAERLGFAPLRIEIDVERGRDLGVLALTPESIPIGGVTVTESPAPATQKGDTTEYRAGAVKTHRDATAEDLVQKLPGVTMEGGQIKAQGENVRQVLVNGRPFFGSDPTAAMRNLPAEVVDRIQVYDRGSDQSEFSGFDDGQSQRTMNFILRDQKARFGKAYAGYGDQDRYQTGGNATVVRGPTRLTLIGMSNNINQKNFSPQDLFGAVGGGGPGGGGGPRIMMFGGGRGGGGRQGGGGETFRMGRGFGGGAFDPGSFLVSQQPGVSTTHSGGFNYSGQWTTKLQVNGSMFANGTDTENTQTLTREYLPPQDSLAFYDQRSIADALDRNQRVDARVEWSPDSMNSVILQPRLYFQNNESQSDGDAANSTPGGDVLGASRSHTIEKIDANNLSSRLTVRHRFAKRGRNVSAEINGGHTRRHGAGVQQSLTEFFDSTAVTRDTVDQSPITETVTNSFSTRLAFTEPLAKGFQAQLIYHPSLTRSEADTRTFLPFEDRGYAGGIDTSLSNSYRNRTTTQNGGLSLLHTRGPWRLLGSVAYQRTRLESDQVFPHVRTIDRTFGEVLPSVTLTGAFGNRRNLRIAWSTSTNNPSIGQLQNVVNNANPLSLTTGNPDLEPTYVHALSARFSEADPGRSSSRFVFLNVSRTSRPIVNSTVTAARDTTIGGVFLARGTQLTAPVNLDASWSTNLFGVVSRPIKQLKSIVSLNGGGTWTRTPTRINDGINRADTWAVRGGTVLSSNVSENLDFTLSYWGTYNLTRSTLGTNDADYFTHSAAFRVNAVVGPGIVLRQELSHVLQSGVPSAYGQDLVLWNTTIGKKLLKDGRGELRLTATDVLEQDKSVNRSFTETYVQDARDRTLGRYVQAVFTYSWR